jgi:hypothetical protein
MQLSIFHQFGNPLCILEKLIEPSQHQQFLTKDSSKTVTAKFLSTIDVFSFICN